MQTLANERATVDGQHFEFGRAIGVEKRSARSKAGGRYEQPDVEIGASLGNGLDAGRLCKVRHNDARFDVPERGKLHGKLV